MLQDGDVVVFCNPPSEHIGLFMTGGKISNVVKNDVGDISGIQVMIPTSDAVLSLKPEHVSLFRWWWKGRLGNISREDVVNELIAELIIQNKVIYRRDGNEVFKTIRMKSDEEIREIIPMWDNMNIHGIRENIDRNERMLNLATEDGILLIQHLVALVTSTMQFFETP